MTSSPASCGSRPRCAGLPRSLPAASVRSRSFLAVSEEVRCLIGADSAGIARFEPDGSSVVGRRRCRGAGLGQLASRVADEARDYMAPTLVWRTGRAALVNEDLWKDARDRIAEGLRSWVPVDGGEPDHRGGPAVGGG